MTARQKLDRLLDHYISSGKKPAQVPIRMPDEDLRLFATRKGPRLWAYRGFELENDYVYGRGRQKAGPTWADRLIDANTGQTTR
jgi:hypothetical protein